MRVRDGARVRLRARVGGSVPRVRQRGGRGAVEDVGREVESRQLAQLRELGGERAAQTAGRQVDRRDVQ